MTSKKTTRRALFSSVIALILCCSMLVGTTFAWFTDEVTSMNNIITAGNLDVELEYAAEIVNGVVTKWDTVNEQTKLFSEKTLWEPGHTEVVYLRVRNAGTLTLKYQLGVNVVSETTGISVKTNKEFKLSDYLVFKVVEMDDALTTYANREAVQTAAGDVMGLKDFNGKTKTLDPKNDNSDADEDYVALIVYMPESVENEANHNGTKVPEITLGVHLFATQKDAEQDSFGPDYDAGAWDVELPVSTEAELITALNAAIGENVLITLANDIVLTEPWTPVGDKDAGEYFTGCLDGNGHTISGLNVAANDYDALISAAKDAVIKNLTVEGTVNGVNAAGIVARVEGNTVIENCVSNVIVTGTTKAGGVVCNVTSADAKIINCVNNADISGGDSGIGGIVGYVNNDAYLEIINCENHGDVTSNNNKYAGAAVGYGAMSKGVVAGFANTGVITGTLLSNNRYLKVGDTVLVGYVNTSGNWTYAETISTPDELVAAFVNLQAGDVLYIAADLDMTGKTITPVTGNKGFTMYGNGHTISNLTTTAAALFVDHSGSSAYTFDSVILENCSVNSTTNYGALFVGDGDTSDAITITNCQVKNCTVKSAKYAAAFVAYTAGWNVVNDGPVYSDVLIENCSVVGGSITGGGSVGAAVAHAGGNVDTTTTISNFTVQGVAINGEDAEHTGVIVGTANVGKAIINNAKYENVTGNYNGLYGRFVPGSTGTLTIDGKESIVDKAGLLDALANGESVILTDNIVISDTLEITEDTVIDLNGNNLTVSRLEAKGEVTITGGTVIHGESTYPAVSVSDGGKLILNDVTIISNNPCNLQTSGELEAAEYVGLQVFGGTCELNNCNIEVNVDKVRYINSAYGIAVHDGTLIMNGGSVKVTSPGSSNNKGIDYQAAFAAWQAGEKTITLNGVTINAKYYLDAGSGNTVVNTTDTEGSWDGKCVASNGTYTINYIP